MTLTAAIYFNYESGLLYWDGTRLQVGSYTPEDGLRSESGTSISYNNVIYAKFGSVVGFTYTGNGDTWDASDIKFDPRTNKVTTWANIPTWGGTASTMIDGYISSTDYHNTTNVQAGYGDICMLAGQTASGARTNIDNGTWRLPTNYENNVFIGDQTFYRFIQGNPGYGLFEGGRALPVLGHRNADTGTANNRSANGCYWSSSPSDAGAYGFNIEFISGAIYPSETDSSHHGFPIRCVRQ